MGSIGVLLPNLEARLVANDENGIVDAAPGNPGELWIRGPTVTKGYRNKPTATADSITGDGWLKTGDIVRRDQEGYYYFVDRKANMINHKVRSQITLSF
jgi:4-coumarate--CoA ligase